MLLGFGSLQLHQSRGKINKQIKISSVHEKDMT